MSVFYDQLGRPVNLPQIPKRIISVVPSQTELLFYLGLQVEVVGITQFCIYPEDEFKSTTKVGGTKKLNLAKIKSLKPDLVIANKEENDRSQVEELMTICPVWISDISNLSGALDMIERVGAMVGKGEEAKMLSQKITLNFSRIKINTPKLRAAYFIWRKPYMVAGKNTFIDNMLGYCGLTNAFDAERYPVIVADALVNANPDIVFLSSEPYPFRERHIAEFKVLLPNGLIKMVDGEMFSWYGSRLLLAADYFEDIGSWFNEPI